MDLRALPPRGANARVSFLDGGFAAGSVGGNAGARSLPHSLGMSVSVARNWIGLSLKQILRTGAVQVRFRNGSGKPEEHEVRRLIDAGMKLDRDLAEVGHFKCDGGVESGV